MGLSHGGATTIKAAALDVNVSCVVTVGAPGNGMRWMKSKRTTEEWKELELRLIDDRVKRVIEGESLRVPYIEMAPPGPAERAAFKTMYKPEETNSEGYPLENIDLAVEFRSEDFIGLISPRPILMIHGLEDTMVPYSEAESLYCKASEPKKLISIPDINHADVYEARNPEVFNTVIIETINWFKKYLYK